MYLERLEIQGFKSFANRTVLEFPHIKGQGNLTAIVGPNGSGKSNTADAIRWVLGEQSLKTLRGKKAQDVIFFGSTQKGQSGMAEVTLYLNNEDGAAPIDYKEVAISRRVYRSGESEYLINNQQVRLQDILLLLAQASFGQRTYSVIGQGMVESILTLSGAERRDFFDEAAGVKQYQIKRDSAMNKFRVTRENLAQTDLTLKELEPHLKSLTRQVKRLERRQEVETELHGLQDQYYSWQYYNLHQEKKSLLSQFQQAEGEKLKKQKEVEEAQNSLEAWEKEESRSASFTNLQQDLQNLFEQKNACREKELRIKNQIELAKARAVPDKRVVTISEVLEKFDNFFAQQSSLAEKLKDLTAEDLPDFKQEFLALNVSLKELIGEIKNPKLPPPPEIDPQFFKDLEKITGELAEINNKIAAAQQQIAGFNAAEEKKKGKFFALQRELQQKQSELSRLVSTSNDYRVSLTRVETQEGSLINEIRSDVSEDFLQKIQNQTEVPARAADDLIYQVKRLKSQLEMIGGIDEEVQEEYEQTKERYDFLFTQYSDLTKALESLEQIITELDVTIKKQFDEALTVINEGFGKYFKVLFSGGQAELRKIKKEAVESEVGNLTEAAKALAEASTEGAAEITSVSLAEKKLQDLNSSLTQDEVEIYACPPGKKIKNISMLSGGERALTSLALVCAIISANSSPFIVLDEVDAALDESNSERFSQILADLSLHNQFIAITHNRATMHNALVLYGVTMGSDGVSKILSLKLEEGEQYANRR